MVISSVSSVSSQASTTVSNNNNRQSVSGASTERHSNLRHAQPLDRSSRSHNNAAEVRSSVAGRLDAPRMGAPSDFKLSRMCFATLGGAIAGAGAGFVITCMGWLGLRNHMNKGINIHANDLHITDIDGNFSISLEGGQFYLTSVDGKVPVEITAGGGVMVDGIQVGNIDVNLLIDAGATVQIDEFTGEATLVGGEMDAAVNGSVDNTQLDGDVFVSIDNETVGVDIGPFPPVLLLVAVIGVFSAVIGFAAMAGERLILLSQRQHPPVQDMRQDQAQNQEQLVGLIADLRAEVAERRPRRHERHERSERNERPTRHERSERSERPATA